MPVEMQRRDDKAGVTGCRNDQAKVGDMKRFVGRKDLAANDVTALFTWLRGAGRGATFGTAGIGAASDLCGRLLRDAAGVELTVLPYKRTRPAMHDLVGGQWRTSLVPRSLFPEQMEMPPCVNTRLPPFRLTGSAPKSSPPGSRRWSRSSSAAATSSSR
ncbi:hypothetical protein CHELA40_13167 [Chelatococcus asaccharovorans]|nr:hypothetical protein CHELA40_13167 [Chelatococcus asaccharovorans]CAH1679919.1 hypothetical protein CHELA17_62453 [Chelatococcus asaccharovorans]